MQRLCLQTCAVVTSVFYEDRTGVDSGGDATCGCISGPKFKRRRNSRWSSQRFIASCTTTAPAEIYQIVRSVNPGDCASSSTGTATMTMRAPDVMSDGMVLPIAWNMLELTNTIPDATKLKAMICRYSAPTAMTCGSEENTPTIGPAASQTMTASMNIAPAASEAPVRNVSRTRSALRAPKF